MPAARARDLCFTPATELARLYRARSVTPSQVMEAVLARVDAVNPRVNAIVTLDRAGAIAAARGATATLRRGGRLGPLHGIPVTIKDVAPTRGMRTTYGSTLFADHVPDEDALVVARIRAAGAIVIGKTNTPEFAFGPNTTNEVFGATRNPWNLSRTSGGSSGGAAVCLATGMGPLAHGSDLGGSLRGPAAFCGVIGFRTSPGLIPRHPSTLPWDTYSVEGPMARTVADTALLLSVMAGPDSRAPLSYDVDPCAFLTAARQPSVRGWRVAWTPDLGGLNQVDPEVAAVFTEAASAFRGLGARLAAASPDMRDVPEIVRLSRGFLMVARHADRLPKSRERLQAGLVENTEAGLALSAREIAQGELLRGRLWHVVREFFTTHDLLLTPTAAVPAFPVEQPYPMQIGGRAVGKGMQRSYLTYAFSVLGLPAISIPAGFTRDGLPVGLQIVGRWRQEAMVLRAAAVFEAARPWADRIPPVVPATPGD
ncbi:MAG TPA: amidase family protein, partial [Candidatus Limnocylindrales bacterium]|nr:amidase family protein [Candidatus Limnocylindrales bacterium]